MRIIGLLGFVGTMSCPLVGWWRRVGGLKEYVDGILKRTVGTAAIWIRSPAHCWAGVGAWGVGKCTSATFHQTKILDNAAVRTSKLATSVQL